MVSILDQSSPQDLVARIMSQGIAKNLPGGLQQSTQRQMGLGAINQLQNDLQGANGDISKILPALMRAYTQNPVLERSGLGQLAMQQSLRGKGAQEFPAGGKVTPGTPGATPTQQGETLQEQAPLSVRDLVPPKKGMIQDPQGTSQFQLPYGPEDISAIRQQARQRGYTPEMEERFVNDALEYNQVAQNRRDAELQNYQQQQQQRRDTLENQAAFEKYLTSHSPEFANNPDELEMALKASEKYQNVPSFAERNAKVKEELRPYQAAKNGLKKTLERPFFGRTKDQKELARNRAKLMVEMGQKSQLQLMIANGGNGEVEEADLLNPLNEQYESHLNSIKPFVNPLAKVTTIDPDSPEYASQLAKGSEMRLKQRNSLTDYLSSEIKPGKDYAHPGTNLLLTRYHLMNKGASWEEAGQMIDEAVAKGKIKLDPQQQIDYQKLAYPPLTGDNYFDTIMNNMMFPITGKQ